MPDDHDEPTTEVELDVTFTGGTIHVMVDGEEKSKHTTTRKAHQSAIKQSLKHPDSDVRLQTDDTRVSTSVHIGFPPAPTDTTRPITTGAIFQFADGQGVVASPQPPPPAPTAAHGKSHITMRLPFSLGAAKGQFPVASGLGRREGTPNETGFATRVANTAYTASDMYLKVETNPTVLDTPYKLVVNGPAGLRELTVTVPAGQVGEFKNTSDTVDIEVGDTFYIECDRSAHASGNVDTGPTGPIFSIVLDAGSSATVTPMCAVGGPYNASAVTEYCSLAQFRDMDIGTEAESQTRVDMDCTIRNTWLYVETNNRTTPTDYTLAINGTPTSISYTVAAGQTGYMENTSVTASVSSGDLVGWQVLGGAETTLIETSMIGVELSATNPGESIIVREHNFPNYEPGTSTTEYWPLGGSLRELDVLAFEADARHEARFECTVDNLSVQVWTNGISAASAMGLNKFTDGTSIASATGMSAPITASTTGWFTDLTTAPVPFLPLDEMALEFTTGATGTTMTFLRTGARITHTPSGGGGGPPSGGFDGVAELPRQTPTATGPDTTGYNVITVDQLGGGDYTSIQDALNDPLILSQHNVIEVTSGQTFSESLKPKRGKAGSFWTVIRPTNHASLPAAGSRISPSDTANMFKVEAPLTGSTWQDCINAESASDRYWWIGMEATVPNDSVDRNRAYIINVSYSNGGVGSNLADYPSNYGFDRCYVYTSLQDTPGRRNLQSGLISFNAYSYSVVNCYGEACRYDGQGGTLVVNLHSPGPGLIQNNYMNVGGNTISGGVNAPPIAGQMADDVTFRRNHVHANSTILDGIGGILNLNMFEIKVGRRWLIEDNIFEGNEAAQVQTGLGILLRNVNQSGFADSGQFNQCTDITFRWNLIEDTPGCMDIAARGSQVSSTNDPMSRVVIHDNLFVDIGQNARTNPNGIHNQWRMNNECVNWHLTNNTFADPGAFREGMMVWSVQPATATGTDFVFRDNIGWRGRHYAFQTAIAGQSNPAEGTASLDAVLLGQYEWDYNVIAGNDVQAGSYPALNNAYPSVSGFATNNFRDPVNRDYRLIPGSAYSSTGTSPSSKGDDRGCNVAALCGSDWETPDPGTRLDGVRQAGV